MHTASKNISDKDILYLLAQNNLSAWQHLYDKYSPAMYGIICRLADNKSMAEKILVKAFLHLQKGEALPLNAPTLCPFLLRYTYNFATEQLNENYIKPKPLAQPDTAKLLHLLCTKASTVYSAAYMLSKPEQQIKKQLREEINVIRGQSKRTASD